MYWLDGAARCSRLRLVAHLSVALGLLGCATSFEEPGRISQYVVYGEDDRREVYELSDPALRASLQESVAAIVPKRLVQATESGIVIEADTFAEKHDLCASERFAQQPSAAMCSGVLVDWDLVLTAGHCLRVAPLTELVFVFGYYYSAPGKLSIRAQDVIEAEAIVDEALSPRGAPEQLDYGFVRLRHAVEAPLQPAPVRRRVAPLVAGEPLINAGTSGGVPLKVDQGASVIDARARQLDFFVADADTSHGASGCGAFDSSGALVGVLARGALDEEQGAAGCSVTRVESMQAAAEEEFTYSAIALEALCARDPSASSLCRNDCEEPCRALPTSASHAGCSALAARSGSRWPGLTLWLVAIGLWRRSVRSKTGRS